MDYCGLMFEWHYDDGYVNVSMPRYFYRALVQFNHTKPTQFQHTQNQWNNPAYGQRVQYANEGDNSEKLNAKRKKIVQAIVGSFLYHGRVLETPTLVALNDIGRQQASPTKKYIKGNRMVNGFSCISSQGKNQIFCRQHAIDSG